MYIFHTKTFNSEQCNIVQVIESGIFWVPYLENKIQLLKKKFFLKKENFSVCCDGGRKRLWHPSSDDAVSKLQEAMRDKPLEVKHYRSQSRGDLA